MLNVAAIPDAIGHYLAGFTDGEGSFNVSFRPRRDYVFPWKVSLCFNVSQRERAILEVLQAHLECGTTRQRANGVWYFEVNNLEDLIQKVIPFFERFGFLLAKKRRDFANSSTWRVFCELASISRDKAWLKSFAFDSTRMMVESVGIWTKKSFADSKILRDHTPDAQEIGR